MGILDFFIKKRKPRLGALSGADRELIRREWEEIEALLKLGDPSGRKEALIRADKALDLALKRISTEETMGERLRSAQEKFSNHAVYGGLWKAHKMRNAMIHEAGFEPPYYSVEKAIEQIKKGLEDLRINLG